MVSSLPFVKIVERQANEKDGFPAQTQESNLDIEKGCCNDSPQHMCQRQNHLAKGMVHQGFHAADTGTQDTTQNCRVVSAPVFKPGYFAIQKIPEQQDADFSDYWNS